MGRGCIKYSFVFLFFSILLSSSSSLWVDTRSFRCFNCLQFVIIPLIPLNPTVSRDYTPLATAAHNFFVTTYFWLSWLFREAGENKEWFVSMCFDGDVYDFFYSTSLQKQHDSGHSKIAVTICNVIENPSMIFWDEQVISRPNCLS